MTQITPTRSSIGQENFLIYLGRRPIQDQGGATITVTHTVMFLCCREWQKNSKTDIQS